jgi:hypothetical protein
MAMAAGKSPGKPPRMTDNAFKPPTEAAMAMTGNARLADGTPISGRPILAGFFGRRTGENFIFMVTWSIPAKV